MIFPRKSPEDPPFVDDFPGCSVLFPPKNHADHGRHGTAAAAASACSASGTPAAASAFTTLDQGC